MFVSGRGASWFVGTCTLAVTKVAHYGFVRQRALNGAADKVVDRAVITGYGSALRMRCGTNLQRRDSPFGERRC